MKHGSKNRTLSRDKNQRRALLRNLAVSLIEKGRIRTTTGKAKELRSLADRLITYGKEGTVASKRKAAQALGEPKGSILKKLDARAQGYKERNGGYTRVIKVGKQSSGKEEAIIEYV